MAKDKNSDEKSKPGDSSEPDGIENGAPPPKPQDDTARIDLSEAETSGLTGQPTGSDLPGDTARIDLPSPGSSENEGKRDTERIAEDDSDSPKSQTARIELESAQPAAETQPISADEARKKETSRINVEDARDRAEPAAQPVREVPEKTVVPPVQSPGDKKKRSTKRVTVDSDDDTQEVEEPDPGKLDTEEIADAVDQTGSGKETMRVVVDEEVTKSETAKIENEVKPEPTPSGTARIKVEEAEPVGDVFSRSQVTIEPKEGPSTLSKKPLSAPADEHKAPSDTDKAKRELAKAETDEIPGADPAPAIAAPPESAGDVPAQSKTARIDVPAETVSAAGGRPKTIKIKRAERPPSTVSGGGKPRIEKIQRPAVAAEEEIGGLYTLLAAVAVVASLVLVYALAAQTIAADMNLPFPGTMGG
jgi:hypothetical protein